MMLSALLFLQLTAAGPSYPYLEMCAARHDQSCAVESITPEDLSSLHQMITAAIITEENPDPYDSWLAFPPGRRGDCDDQVATERAALIALGMDPKALTIETGKVTEADGRVVGHVVLLVDLGGETYVLDRKVPQGAYTAAKRPKVWTGGARQNHAGVIWRKP